MSKFSKIAILFITLSSFQCSDTPLVFENQTTNSYSINMQYKIKTHGVLKDISKQYNLNPRSCTPIIPRNVQWESYFKYSPSRKIKFIITEKTKKVEPVSLTLSEKDMIIRDWTIVID
jgi:hypothetical protein